MFIFQREDRELRSASAVKNMTTEERRKAVIADILAANVIGIREYKTEENFRKKFNFNIERLFKYLETDIAVYSATNMLWSCDVFLEERKTHSSPLIIKKSMWKEAMDFCGVWYDTNPF